VPSVLSDTLITGERMDSAEFLRRWDALPDVNNAELIEGVVFVPSPVSLDHAELSALFIGWLIHYVAATPGCQCGNEGTWLMLDSVPQPDAFLRIRPEYGGQSRDQRRKQKVYPAGAPELAVEICLGVRRKSGICWISLFCAIILSV
jgi:hypothetical protein